MTEYLTQVHVIEVREAVYGRFNREIVAILPDGHLSVSAVEEKDCSLPIGRHAKNATATVAEFFSGTKLISRI